MRRENVHEELADDVGLDNDLVIEDQDRDKPPGV